MFVVLLLYALHAVRRPRAALQINNGIREQYRERARERELPVMKKERLREFDRERVCGIAVQTYFMINFNVILAIELN